MQKSNSQQFAPTIGIHSFRKEQIVGRTEIIFNELNGEKRIISPHKHDFFIIILFDQASGIHTIDAIDYTIGNKEIHVLFPGQTHKWHLKENTKGYQFMIEPNFLEQFAPFFRFSITNYQNHPVIKLSEDSYKKISYEFQEIKEELKREKSLLQLLRARAAVIATIISTEAEEVFTEFKVYQSNEKLAKFNMLIDEFYKQQKSVTFYADKLHISANYLNILCKRNLKISAIELIHQRVSIEAKRHLQNNKLTIKEIAYDLGFSNNSYFSVFFKNQTGISPSDFRGHD